jgi:tetratricopeptide (TPR) repeat protein
MGGRTYSDFRIELDRTSGAGEVEVNVVSQHGETTDPVVVPLAPHELRALVETAERLMTRDLLADELVRFGQQLGKLLFPSRARTMFFRAMKDADDTTGVRLRLVVNDAELAMLPWEYVYVEHPTDHARFSSFLALDPRISIVRHERQETPMPTVRPFRSGQFRLLIAAATSAVPGEVVLDDGDEDAITAALDAGVDGIELQAVVLDDPVTRSVLRDALIQQFDAFQFIGHGEEASADGAGGLVIVDDDGTRVTLDAEELAEWLRQADVRIAVLSACHSGRREPSDQWIGTSSVLVRAGVPAVVAMQHMIESSHALAFESGFYSGLAAGLSLDEAVALGRRKINDLGILSSWGVPVLYTRTDGTIFSAGPARDEVADQLRSAIRSVPLSPAEGLQLESQGQWARAVTFYERSLERAVTPRDRVLFAYRLGACLWRDGRIEEGRDRLDDARHDAGLIDDEVLHGEVLLEIGMLLEESDLLNDARQWYLEAQPLLAGSTIHSVRVSLSLASLQRRHGELRSALITLDAIDRESLSIELQAEYDDTYGAVLVARGQYRDAVEMLTRALDLDERLGDDPDSHRTASSRLLLAEAYLGAGMRVEAQREVDAAIEIYERADDASGLSEAHVLQGQIQEDAGEYRDALRSYQRASSFDAAGEDKGGEARAYRMLGRTARKRGDLDAAEEYFERARSLLRQSHDEIEKAALSTEEGLLDLDEGKYAEAINHFRRALDSAEKDEDERAVAVAKRNLASALYESGDLPGAVRLLEEARPVLEDRGDIRELVALLDDLGEVLLDLSEHERAIDALHESEKLDMDLDNGRGRGRTQLLLGRAHLAMGRREIAAEYLEAALDTFKTLDDKVGQSDALFELGRWAADEGQVKQAQDHLLKALRIDRKQEDRLGIVRCHRVLAGVFRRSGDWMRADDHILDARNELAGLRDPMESALLDLERAHLALARGESEEAIELARDARDVFDQLHVPEPVAQCDRITAKAHAATGEIERALGLLNDARVTFDRLGAISELSETYDDIAEIHLERGDLVEARRAVEQSLDLDRDQQTEWHSSQGRSLMIKGDIESRGERPDAAPQLYLEAIEHLKSNETGLAEVHLRLGAWHLEHAPSGAGSMESASRSFKEARRLFQRHQDARGVSRALRYLGEVYLARHEHERAEEALEQAEDMLGALRSDPERAPLHVAQGDLFAARGMYAAAIDDYERALALYREMHREDRGNEVLRRLAKTHQNNGDLEQALECLRQIGRERARLWNVLLANLHEDLVQTCGVAYREGRFDRAVSNALAVASSWLREAERDQRADDAIRSAVEFLSRLVEDPAWQPNGVDALAAISVAHLVSTMLSGEQLVEAAQPD